MGTGIFGASYFAAAGIYKNLGYLPAGYDGIDNDGNGLIDEWAEGVNSPLRVTTSPPTPPRSRWSSGNLPPTSTTRRGPRRSMPSWSGAWGPWARSSAPTTSATGR